MKRGQRRIGVVAALVASLVLPFAGVAAAQQADPSTTTTPATSTPAPSTTAGSSGPTTTTSSPASPSTTSPPTTNTATPSTGSQPPADTTGVQPAPDPIPGHYIVTFKSKDKAQVLPETIRLSKENGAKVSRVYGTALQGFAAEMSPSEADRLARDPAVDAVYQDGYVHMATTQPLSYSTTAMTGGPDSWGLDRIDQTAALAPSLTGTYTYNADGLGVHAYVIDTGVRITNSDFEGRASLGADFGTDGLGPWCASATTGPTADSGHGTHVAGTIGGKRYGVAKKVSIVSVRVLNCTGSGTDSAVIAGVDWVTSNAIRPAVANMSLGINAVDTPLNNAVETSIASGVTYAVAAGNSNADACSASPSSAPDALTVGSSTVADARSSFSNFGTCVDLFAPGSSITSDWNTSDTATNIISGTSMATPHVAGAAALYLSSNPCAAPSVVATALTTNATKNALASIGAGSPNLLLNEQFIGSDASFTPGGPCPPVVTASVVSGQPHLSWTIDTTDGPAPSTFNVYRGTTPGGEAASPLAVLSSSATSYDDPTATPGVTYYYEVGAANGVGEARSSEVAIAVLGAPGNVSANPGNGHVLVTWTAAPAGSAPVTGYTVGRSTTPGTEQTIGSVGTAAPLQFDDVTASNGTTYYYTVTANSSWGNTTSAEVSATPTDWTGTYVPLAPARILDSRVGTGLNGAFTNGTVRTLQVAGRGGVPSSGVSAVVMNVTVTNAASAGFVTAYPSGPLPNASNLNFVAGQTVPNLVTVGLSGSGTVNLVVTGGPADLVADVQGFYAGTTYVALAGATGSKYHPSVPTRILDTRSATQVGNLPTWGPNTAHDIVLTGVPADATAVAVNVTVTNPSAASWATVYPSGVARPDPASTLNFVAGQTVPNFAIVKIGTNGEISLYNLAGNADFIVDVVGWYGGSLADSIFTPIAPARILDSRVGNGLSGPFTSDVPRTLQVTGRGGVPSGASAVVANVTVTDTAGPGHVIVWPADAAQPDVSNLNFTTGLTVPNLVMVKLAAGTGDVDMLVHGGPADLIADVVGYFTVPGP
jgi:subtilisin family serine protease